MCVCVCVCVCVLLLVFVFVGVFRFQYHLKQRNELARPSKVDAKLYTTEMGESYINSYA